VDDLPSQEKRLAFYPLTFFKQRFKLISLSFFFLVLLLIIVAFLFSFLTSPNLPPREIKISNQTGNSLAISWVTNRSVKQKIFYSQTPISLSQLFLAKVFPSQLNLASDDFGLIETTAHHITLKDLEPETQSFFVITNGWRFYQLDSQNQSFPTAKTVPPLASPPSPSPCYGTVLDFAQEKPLDPVVVYLSSKDSNLISAFTNSAGNYTFDLASLRSADLQEPVRLNQNSNLLLEFQGGLWGTGKQPLYLKSCQPIKTMILE